MSRSPYAPNKLTIRQVNEMRRRFLAGETRDALAGWFDVSPTTIWHHTSDLKRPKVRLIDRSKVLDMLIAGKTQAAIAREFKVSPTAILHVVNKMRAV